MKTKALSIVAAALTLAIGVAAIPAARAGVPEHTIWRQVTGPRLAGTQLGLARVNGVLYVASSEGLPATITVTRIDANNNVLGSSTVASGFDGTGGLALLAMPDGSLRLFAAGGRTLGLGSSASGVNSYVSPPGGTTWSLDPSALWGGAVASAADELGAAVAGNGWVVTTWSGAIVHLGLAPSDGDPSYQPDCCGAEPEVATDGATGAVVLAWITNGHTEGTFVREIWPSEAAVFALPSGTSSGSFGLSARIGAPGTYVAYVDQAQKKVQLYEYSGGITTLASGAFQIAKVFPGPGGRLWMVWGSAGDGLFVTRSNKAVTRFEPIRQFALPTGTNGLYNAEGEGSIGPLDLFVDILTGTSSRGFARTRLLPEGTLTMRTSQSNQLTPWTQKKTTTDVNFTVSDAGDPIANAVVMLRRGDTPIALLHTDSHGHAELHMLTGNWQLLVKQGVKVTATAPNYTIVAAPRGP